MQDLKDEVVECVLAKARAGDVPEDIARAAAADHPDNPAVIADILELMIEREMVRRVQAGEVIAHVGADGDLLRANRRLSSPTRNPDPLRQPRRRFMRTAPP